MRFQGIEMMVLNVLDMEEMIGDLFSLGIPRNQAAVITLLARVEQATSNEICEETSLRQPEVSKAVAALQKRGWVKTWDVIGLDRGSSRKIYALNVSLEEIVRYLEAGTLSESEHIARSFERLRKLAC